MNKELVKAIWLRFARAFVFGALASITLATLNDVHTWAELAKVLNMLGISAVIGGINGVYMAIDKAARFQ